MHIKEFDYELPNELIAQYPMERRDQSRLMVLNRKNKTIEHRQFFEITDYFKSGDVLVLNDTKVIPARLIGRKQSGGKVEVFLLKPHENGSVDEKIWHCLINCGKKPKPGSKIFFNQSLTAEIIEEAGEEFKVEFEEKMDLYERQSTYDSFTTYPGTSSNNVLIGYRAATSIIPTTSSTSNLTATNGDIYTTY